MTVGFALEVRVVGVTFAPGYPRNLVDLRACIVGADVPEPLELVRDLDNRYDLHAISVRWRGRHLGWIPRDFAQFIAPDIDAGDAWEAEAEWVAVDLEHRERPGLRISVRRAA